MADRLRTRKQERPKLLREQHRDHTRSLIMDALAKVITERGVHSFSVQDVADTAGVSHRTVYRYFPTRESLLDALAEWLEEIQVEYALPGTPLSADELPEQARRSFAFFDANASVVRALAIVSSTTKVRFRAKEERSAAFRRVVQELAPSLPATELDSAAAAIRCLASSQSWLYLRDQLGLSGERAGESVAWALRTLLNDLAARSAQAAAKSETTEGAPHE